MDPQNNAFPLSIQKAGYELSQSVSKGFINFQDFVQYFERFPWIQELEKAHLKPEKAFPTLTIKAPDSEHYLWVSIHSYPYNPEYLVGFIYPKKIKGLWVLRKEKNIIWEEIYKLDNQTDAHRFFYHFFELDFESIQKDFHQLEQYSSMEIVEIVF